MASSKTTKKSHDLEDCHSSKKSLAEVKNRHEHGHAGGIPTEKNIVGYVFEERFLWHNPWSVQYSPLVQPFQHWEHADTKRRFHNLLLVSGLSERLVHLGPNIEAATIDQIRLVHTLEYIQDIQKKSKLREGGLAENCTETTFSQYAFDIASRAVGAGLLAVEKVMMGDIHSAYVLCRPPGHHALPKQGMGFCIFNNIAIAAKHLLRTYPREICRIAIVDYDVHHGNGTQDIFYNDDNCLFISIHQDSNYPIHSGNANEIGGDSKRDENNTGVEGHDGGNDNDNGNGNGNGNNKVMGKTEGEGATINVPLPPGSGGGAYKCVFDTIVLPALDRFVPDFILVSSGFDASYADPLSAMILSSADFRNMSSCLMRAAERLCQGRIVFFHEGGYSEVYVPFCGVAVIEEMVGVEKNDRIKDPFLDEVKNWGGQELQMHQFEVVDRVAQLHGLERPIYPN